MDVRETITAQTNVALRLTKHILQTQGKDSNVVLSPSSINLVLGLIAAGSKGPTLDQLLSFLNSKSTDHLNSFASELVAVVFADGSAAGGPRVSFANGAWVERSLPLRNSFKQVVEGSYKSALAQVDFQNKADEVTKEVNSWAEKETNGLIKEVLPSGSVDSSTRLIFANALYFKGAWAEKFDPSKTKDEDFHLLNGASVKVPFMTTKTKQLVTAHEGFKVLSLPYHRGNDKRRFSLCIFLPDARDGLRALVDRVGSSEPGFIEQHVPYQRVEVGEFRLPKFKVAFGFEASEALKGLGLELPFSGQGGLSEMVDSPVGSNLYVSSVFHKSFIEVNEEGTEAASASAAVVQLRCFVHSEKVDFVADHPFMFVLREDLTGMVLFSGQVVNPLAI